MQVFNFSTEQAKESFLDQNFVHIKKGVSDAFLSDLQQTAERLIENAKELKSWKIPNKKGQFLYDFPEEIDLSSDFLDWISEVTGLSIDQRKICERHIKVYHPDALPDPKPHLDRSASEIAVGIPIKVAPSSHIAIYPEPILSNPFSSTAKWKESSMHEKLIEDMLSTNEPEKIYDQPGDVVMFLGSQLLHERINPAGTIVLYIKVNAAGLDPLGEDPSTPITLANSLDLIANEPTQLQDKHAYLSPKVDRISTHFFRPNWQEVAQVNLIGGKEISISTLEFELLKKMDKPQPVVELIAFFEAMQYGRAQLVETLTSLGEREIIIFE